MLQRRQRSGHWRQPHWQAGRAGRKVARMECACVVRACAHARKFVSVVRDCVRIHMRARAEAGVSQRDIVLVRVS